VNDKSTANPSLNYRDAGVDIDAGSRLVERIKPIVAKTQRPEVIGGLGGFGALFEIPLDRYKKPVLVSGTDGVGTKLKLAMEMKKHDTIGIDLVAMCVNDLIVQGAEPLFFLDYYATGKLDVENGVDIVKGIAEGCLQSGAALIGGETAEMPGMYQGEDYDLAGFCVGIVEKEAAIDGSKVKAGDTLIGIASSGPHSNGYSLIRKIIAVSGASLSDTFGDSTLGDALLTPTRIYIKPLLALLKEVELHALSHITGGGLLENIPRVLPKNCAAKLNADALTLPAIFQWLQEQGNIELSEMYRTFNCGIGMVICLPEEHADQAVEFLNQHGEKAWKLGEIITIEAGTEQVIIE